MSKYNEVFNYLSSQYEEVSGFDFYNDLFPDNELSGEFNTDYSKPNGIYLYTDENDKDSKRRLRRKIMLKDTWENDYVDFVEENPMTLCSGLTYRGRTNKLEHAQQMNALVFDLDGVGLKEINILFNRMDLSPDLLRTVPRPTYVAMSGSGLHLYYFLDEPIDLFPNIKNQFRELKHDLTFRIWEYRETTREENIQYQGINQGFRMVGSNNNKYDLPVKAFKTGERVSLQYLNSYCNDKSKMVDLNKKYFSKHTLKEAEMKFPEWYQKVVVEKNYKSKHWIVKRDLYDWWKTKITFVKGGHRYYFLMVLVIYAIKCDVPKNEVKKDLYELYETIKDIDHSHALSVYDIESALDVYDPSYHNFPIDVIIEKTGIQITKNKRNYRTQEQHLERARAVQEIDYPNGEWRYVKPSKEELVLNYLKDNPNQTPTQISKALNISRPTVYKYLKK